MLRDRRALDLAAGDLFATFFSRAIAEEVAGVTSLAAAELLDELAEAVRFGGVRGALRSVSDIFSGDFDRFVGVLFDAASLEDAAGDAAAAAVLLRLLLREGVDNDMVICFDIYYQKVQ